MNKLFAKLLFAALVVASVPANAGTYDVETKANRAVGLGNHYVYSRTCRPQVIPDIKVKKEPKHGKVILRTVVVPVSEKKWPMCKGKKTKARQVIYKPNKNYRGDDKFTVQYSFPKFTNGSTRRYVTNTFKVKVK
ncbi:hypothetical protein [Flexibacterium corallicola]|uniref:hypothetical protein n=1 Tax=Flexibacterium corallicola TaxID=3037259 RepID=UPI00286F7433|nr:hypothetical protein [Pseudovibrio sp. M1P-2-3]